MFIFIEIISLLTLDYGAWIKNCISETFCDAVGNKIHCQSSEQNSLMSVMTEKVPSVPLNLTPSRTVISILFLTPFNSTVINSLLFLFSLNNPAAESLAVEGEGQARDVIGVCSLRTEWDTRDGTQRPHGGLSLSTLTALTIFSAHLPSLYALNLGSLSYVEVLFKFYCSVRAP